MATGAKNVQYRLENDMIDDLKNVAKMTGKTMSEIVRDALDKELAGFRNRSGRVKIVPAVWVSGVSDYEKKVAENEGRKAVEEEHGCFVIDEIVMYGEPYYSVFDNETGQVMKVQKMFVKFSKENNSEV